MAIVDALRFPIRTAAFAGLTFSLYGGLEVDTLLSSASEREAVLRKWIQRYGKSLLRLYGTDVRARGPYVERGEKYPARGKDGKGRLFLMNHRSGLDIPITLAFIEATIVSRADLADWPVIGMAARRVGTLFVDRESKRSGAAVISAMTQAVERGIGVMVYPEGGTFAGDEVRPLKPGAFLVAKQTGCEVVPVGLAYEEGGSTYGDEPFLEHMKRVSRTAHTNAAIAVGEPLDLGDRSDVDTMRHVGRSALQTLVNEARTLLG